MKSLKGLEYEPPTRTRADRHKPALNPSKKRQRTWPADASTATAPEHTAVRNATERADARKIQRLRNPRKKQEKQLTTNNGVTRLRTGYRDRKQPTRHHAKNRPTPTKHTHTNRGQIPRTQAPNTMNKQQVPPKKQHTS
eukprot:GHVN01025324.1.p1 GENE.GHVN01025324.1~~GHVN01025324.1.p1  ORF type:complete len:139 (+),score=12.27 GHVN01025324.1:118-534(+)